MVFLFFHSSMKDFVHISYRLRNSSFEYVSGCIFDKTDEIKFSESRIIGNHL